MYHTASRRMHCSGSSYIKNNISLNFMVYILLEGLPDGRVIECQTQDFSYTCNLSASIIHKFHRVRKIKKNENDEMYGL